MPYGGDVESFFSNIEMDKIFLHFEESKTKLNVKLNEL